MRAPDPGRLTDQATRAQALTWPRDSPEVVEHGPAEGAEAFRSRRPQLNKRTDPTTRSGPLGRSGMAA